MFRTLVLAAAFALSAGMASAAGGPPYQLDAAGKCHDSAGAFAKVEMCKTKPAAPATRCKNDKGQFAKCGSPGAKPVK